MKKTGFTLIELLVVITVIGILGSIVMAVGNSMMIKSQIKGTQGTILTLISAIEQYRAVFYAYPNLDYPPTGYPGTASTISNTGGKYTDNDYKEFNKRLRYMLEERTYTVDEVTHDPFLSQTLSKVQDSSGGADNKDMYCDAWGNFLRIAPGRDHRNDNPVGPNFLDPNFAKSRLPKDRIGTPIDIFSTGINGENEVDSNANNKDTTAFNTTDSDDIVSWLLDTKYIEETIHKKKNF